MKYIIGIDEVGRGALAGPVVVAAAKIANSKWRVASERLGKLRDSKKLSPKQREAWFAYFKNHPNISYAVAFVYPRQIEKRNISGAANLAALRAYQKLASSPRRGEVDRIPMRAGGILFKSKMRTPSSSPSARGRSSVFLDGGLFLGSKKLQPLHAKTVIKGDEKIPAISIASIIAKVIRDRAMVRLAKQYPSYGLEVHKGYGTLAHRKAIKKHGPSDIHRKTFLKKI